ncbi:alpha/beta fold hydrolase [Catenuloplanes japonicus]|uniref:alpha/beta fold hydrolase n=1 Tax=Catenuloplanes japonicus TaxID=33876 RepID=UPI0007C4913A|nr:alpha/beta hydrolase [Catenuloplanes japonicus]
MNWLPPGFSAQVVEANGTRISVATGGDGPPMVLLHGWPQTGRVWRKVMVPLAERYTVVVPDLRGAGDSDRPADGYTKTNQARDMHDVLHALGLAGPAVVIGHDIGAMVGLGWAASIPEDVRALIMLDALLPGFGLEESMDVANGGMWHFGFFMTPDVPEMLFDGHELEFITTMFPLLSGRADAFTDEDFAYYAQAYRGRDRLRGGFAQYRALLTDGRENRALLADRHLTMPVLTVGAGAHLGDAPVPAPLSGHADDLTALAAPTGHFVAEEDPGWLLATISTFLGERS